MTGPTAVAVSDKVRKPSAINTMASIGLPAISPHMLSGLLAARHAAMTWRNNASIGADSRS